MTSVLAGERHTFRLAFELAKRAVFARYRESLLGPLWAVITPLVLLAIYSFVFAAVFQTRWDVPGLESVNFGLLLYSGLLIFGFFAEAINGSTGLIAGNAPLVKRTSVPLWLLPGIPTLASVLTTLLGCIPFSVFYLYEQGVPPATALLIPAVLLPLFLLTVGLVLLLSSLSVYFRDFVPITYLFTTFILFTSPIFYPESAVPESLEWVLRINPVAATLSASKAVLFAGVMPEWSALAMQLMVAIVVLILGAGVFRKLSRGFADVI